MSIRATTIRSASPKPASRRWRSALAAVISLALVLSFFHGWSSSGDEDAPAVSIARAYAADASEKTPAHQAPAHGDHCLTHVSSVVAQETSFVIDCIASSYRSADLAVPEKADLSSPFKPPRA